MGIDGFDKSKMKLVINKYDASFNISPEEIAGVLKIPLIAVIPDFREITNVNNSGNSVFYGSSKSVAKQQNLRTRSEDWQNSFWKLRPAMRR